MGGWELNMLANTSSASLALVNFPPFWSSDIINDSESFWQGVLAQTKKWHIKEKVLAGLATRQKDAVRKET